MGHNRIHRDTPYRRKTVRFATRVVDQNGREISCGQQTLVLGEFDYDCAVKTKSELLTIRKPRHNLQVHVLDEKLTYVYNRRGVGQNRWHKAGARERRVDVIRRVMAALIGSLVPLSGTRDAMFTAEYEMAIERAENYGVTAVELMNYLQRIRRTSKESRTRRAGPKSQYLTEEEAEAFLKNGQNP